MFMLLGVCYVITGGAFTIGQTISTELGVYELWDKQKRFLVSNLIGAVVLLFTIALTILFSIPLWAYPPILFPFTACAKLAAKAANSAYPEALQPTSEELRARYGPLFAIGSGEVKALLENEFTKRLFSSEERSSVGPVPSFIEPPDLTPGSLEGVSETELRRAVENFVDRWKRRWVQRYGRDA